MDWERAQGSLIVDRRGKSYIDFTSGVIVANVGHGHARVVQAIRRCLSRPLLHCYKHGYRERSLLERELIAFAGGRFVETLLAPTGSDAIEICLRACLRRRPGRARPLVVSFAGGFHGKSLGAAGLSSIERYRCPALTGTLEWVKQLPFPATDEIGRGVLTQLDRLRQRICGIFVECVQGSTMSGISPSSLGALRRWCSDHGAVLVVDEIQTGCFRTGRPLACMRAGIDPDLLCMGKGLTSSLPLAALLVGPGMEGTVDRHLDSATHMANPLSVAAARACLGIYRSREFRATLAARERHWMRALTRIGRRLAAGITMKLPGGLWAGLHFSPERFSTEILTMLTADLAARGVLVAAPVGPALSLVKLAPPLTITAPQLERGLSTLEAVLQDRGLLRTGRPHQGHGA